MTYVNYMNLYLAIQLNNLAIFEEIFVCGKDFVNPPPQRKQSILDWYNGEIPEDVSDMVSTQDIDDECPHLMVDDDGDCVTCGTQAAPSAGLIGDQND